MPFTIHQLIALFEVTLGSAQLGRKTQCCPIVNRSVNNISICWGQQLRLYKLNIQDGVEMSVGFSLMRVTILHVEDSTCLHLQGSH